MARYEVTCRSREGVRWRDGFSNIVVVEGLTDCLEKHFKGSTYTASWFVGLTDSAPTFTATDTMAAHPGWDEVTGYAEPTRPPLALGSVADASVDNSEAPASFAIDAPDNIGGMFVGNNDVKGGASGVLYGGGPFEGGDHPVYPGDEVECVVVLGAQSGWDGQQAWLDGSRWSDGTGWVN